MASIPPPEDPEAVERARQWAREQQGKPYPSNYTAHPAFAVSDMHIEPGADRSAPRKRRRWPWIVAVYVVLLVVGIVIGSCAVDRATVSNAGPTASSASQPPAAPADPMTSKGWHAADIRVTTDQFGTQITARVTNQQNETRTSVFTLTMLRNGQTVATATGSASDVPAGQTVTVQFVSTDKLTDTAGLEYQFQSDF